MFFGVASLTLDNKGRMTIPIRFRGYLLEDNSKNVLALIESRDGCLLLMSHNLWSKKVNELIKDGSDEQRRFWIGLSDTPEIDRSGRVLINSVLRNGAGINKEIILLGVGKHLEIWDESNLHNHKINSNHARFNLEASEK